MARGIYKHTMRRASTGTSGNRESASTREHQEEGDSRSSPPPAPSYTPENDSQRATPLIGKRTIYVDRQVARRARSRSKTTHIRRLKVLIAVLVVCLVGVSMGWIMSSAKLAAVESDKLALDADLRRTEDMLEDARNGLQKREGELVDLVENRIPGLDALEFNKLIDINDEYVLNVTFAQSGVEDEKGIEYHAMLKNETAGMILPDVKIFLFDELGLQAGVANLEKTDATRLADLAELAPGETRSYHAKIEIERNATPKYYMIYVQ